MYEGHRQKLFANDECHWWLKTKKDVVKKFLSIFAVDLRGKKILDAGCGTGFLSINLAPNLANVYGVDSSGTSLEHARQRGLLHTICADLNKLPFNNNTFDVCFCMDVLEHNLEDQPLINELGRVMCRGGILIVTVPASPSLWGPQDDKLGHFRRYKKERLANLFSKDFEIMKISYSLFSLFPAVFILRKFFKLFPKIMEEKDELDINNKFLNSILYKILKFEGGLLKYIDYPAGVSLVAMARKK